MTVLFYVADTQASPPTAAVRLAPIAWDDYGYKTTFEIWLPNADAEVSLGRVKILSRNYRDPEYRLTKAELPDQPFSELDSAKFCSMGQSSLYYEKLRLIGERRSQELADALRRGLNDIAVPNPAAEDWWTASEGCRDSLLRYRDAQIAKMKAAAILSGQSVEAHTVNHVRVRWMYPELTVVPTSAEFRFNGNAEIPRRTCVLVGKNGAGKTHLLCNLARAITRDARSDKYNAEPTFSRVIVVSYNAFDAGLWQAQELAPGSNLRLVGYRATSAELSELAKQPIATAASEWAQRLGELCPTPARLRDQLPARVDDGVDALAYLGQDREWAVFCRDAFEDSALAEKLLANPQSALREMSAGQRVLTSLYANLFHHLDRQSLVLLDEPENHLHPSLIARFIRQLGDLLDARKAFAIVATHSPIVVQETPADSVWVVRRNDKKTHVENPPFETFGETTDNIADYLFGTDFRSSAWKASLQRFVAEGLGAEEIRRHVGEHPLPTFASAYLQLLIARRDGSGQ